MSLIAVVAGHTDFSRPSTFFTSPHAGIFSVSAKSNTVESAVSGRHHGCRFVVGDSVRFYQERAILHVIGADGKECKAEVLRQERLK